MSPGGYLEKARDFLDAWSSLGSRFYVGLLVGCWMLFVITALVFLVFAPPRAS